MNQLSERGRFISKSEAAMLQAVAVMLMVWHHLFGFPDRISEPYVLIFNFFIPIETFVADFGRICIAVFAFVSGYGLRKKISNSGKHAGILKSYQLVGAQLLKFFSRYWAVFFVFVPLGFLLKVYPVDVNRFLKGVLGIGSGYNGEWWYVNYYVRFLLLFPIMTFLTDIILKRVPVLMHILMAVAVISLLIAPKTLPYYDFFTVLICFAEGMYFIESNIFETIYRPFQKKPWLRLIVGIVLFGAVFVLRFKGVKDYLLVATFVFSVMLICKTESLMRWLRPPLLFVGQYSTYVWLTHTFFAYYFFQKLTFAPRYSWLIFLWCMVLSFASGMVLEELLALITKMVKNTHRGVQEWRVDLQRDKRQKR